MSDSDLLPLCIQDYAPAQRQLRVAVVTETYPPEVNGVAMTLGRMVDGLIRRGHQVQLVRPRQTPEEQPQQDGGLEEFLATGVPIPRYAGLKLGMPAKRALHRLWALQRPDLVHVVTEGPLGNSAIAAAHKLKLPVTSDFHTNFHAYSRHYGIGWLQRPIAAYLRRFHNHTEATFVPTHQLARELEGQATPTSRWWPGGWIPGSFPRHAGRRSCALAGVRDRKIWWCSPWDAWPRKKICPRYWKPSPPSG